MLNASEKVKLFMSGDSKHMKYEYQFIMRFND